MVNEVVVEDDELHRLIPFERRSFDDAVREALADRDRDPSPAPGLRERVAGMLRRG